jgi:peptidoglycan/xylan/chitin deacetylase (PgdA/CDA1 family)
MSLAELVLALAAGTDLAEAAASLLLGPAVGQALLARASAHAGPGRAAGPVVALSFDVDFRADVAALPDLVARLTRLGLTASFACVGEWVRRYPAEHRLLVDSGQEIVNHTQTHPDNEELDPGRHFHRLAPSELLTQVTAAHRTIEEHLEISPVGFRAPHFGYQHTAQVYPILAELGYAYSSSTLASRQASGGWPIPAAEGLWELPVTVCPRHPFSSFDTWHFLRKRPSRHRPDDFLDSLAHVLEASGRLGLPLAFYFDPRDFDRRGGRAAGRCAQALDLLAGSGREIVGFGGWAGRLGKERTHEQG